MSRKQFSVVLALVVLSVANTGWAHGFKGWRLGMTRAQVQSVRDCTPYTAVRITGGLECRAFSFLGRRGTISFVFGANGLRKIQVWVYQGRDARLAGARLAALIGFFKQRFGALTSPQLPRIGAMSTAQLQQLVQSMQRAGQMTKYQLKPLRNPTDRFVFASLIYHPRHGFFLFFYTQPPRR